MRYEDETIKQLKYQAGVEPYRQRLHGWKPEGRKYKATCPFHSPDRNPSLEIAEKDREWVWHCFPCSEGGDVINFVRKVDNVSFTEAVKRIAKSVDFQLAEQEHGQQEREVNATFNYEPDKAASRLTEVMPYLEKRGISQEIAEKYGLGAFDFPGLGLSVAMPYGRTGAAKFRAVEPKNGKKFRHNPKNPTDHLLYGIEELDWLTWLLDDRIFITESELDALTLVSHGFAAVSVTSATTVVSKDAGLKIKPEYVAEMEQAEKIFLCFDMDGPGQECATAFEAVLPSYKTYRLTWDYQKGVSGAKDVGELYAAEPATFGDRFEALVTEAINRPPKWRSLFRSYAEMESGELQFLAEGLIPEGITFFGGLPESAKSWFGLSLAKALVTGKNFLKIFPTPEPMNVLYLAPENGEKSFRKRMETIRITDNPRFLCRTAKQGVIALNDQMLVKAVTELKPAIILDTAIRFIAGVDENAAGQISKCLGDMLIGLIQAGALGVVAIHHAVKKSGDKSLPDLQQILRGSGDIGALADAVLGLKVIDKRTLKVKVYNAKARDFDPPPPFIIQGRPYLDEEGDFAVIVDPFQTELDILNKTIKENPDASNRELSRRTGTDKNRIPKLIKQLGYSRRGKALVQAKKGKVSPAPEHIM